MGAAESSMNAADRAESQAPGANADPALSPEQPTTGSEQRGTKRQRDSNEQAGPTRKRHRNLSASEPTSTVLNSSAGTTSLPVRVSRNSRPLAPPPQSAEPVKTPVLDEQCDGSRSPPEDEPNHRISDTTSPDLATTDDAVAQSATGMLGDSPHAAVQAAAELALDADQFEGWRLAPEAPLSDFQRQNNRREINGAVMRLQPLTKSESFGRRGAEDHDLFARLSAGTRQREPEDNRVDFVQKAKAARLKSKRMATRLGRSGGKLVMPVSKKRRRSSEGVGERDESTVYKVAQTDGDSPLLPEGTPGLQRPLHGLWKTWPGMMKERWD